MVGRSIAITLNSNEKRGTNRNIFNHTIDTSILRDSIQMQKFTPIAALLTLFLGTATAPPALGTEFTDTQTHWGRDCIDLLHNNNLVSGYPDGSFRPEATVTRAEFAILMLNTFPSAPRVRTAPRFTDVPSNYWAARAISSAAERAFFSGYPDGTFKPNQAIPRVQAIAVISGAKQFPIPENYDNVLDQYFEDALQIPRYAERSIAAATLGGIVINYPNVKKLQPNRNATRGEIAAMLCQAQNRGEHPLVPMQYIASEINLYRNFFAFPPEIRALGRFSEGLVTAELENDKVGYIDDQGKVIIPAKYRFASEFSEGLAWVAQENGEDPKIGYIDKTGKWIISPQFINAESFSEGLAVVSWDGTKYGVIDRTGKTIVPPQFDVMFPFSEGLAAVSVNDNRWGFIDKTGEIVIPMQFNFAEFFSDGLAKVDVDGKYGFIDRTGNIVIEPKWVAVRSFSEGLAPARDETTQKWGFINQTGNWAIDPIYDAVQEFSEGLAGVAITEKWGFVDRTGKVVISPQFFSPQTTFGEYNPNSYPVAVEPFSDGLALVRSGTGIGFVDYQGRWFIDPIIYNDAQYISEGMARVHIGGEWVPEYDYANSDVYFRGITLQGGGWGYIYLPKPLN
jgi:S-layer homology domain/WG containing repeat